MNLSAIQFAKDSARLAALESYAVLYTPAETTFEDITRIASMICQTPIALVSLVDSGRQWFKSAVDFRFERPPSAHRYAPTPSCSLDCL